MIFTCFCLCIKPANVRHFKWSVGLIYCVSWILYACNDKSLVNILCKVIVDKSDCWALWRLELFGFSTTSPLTAAMFSTERLLWAHTVLFTSATDLVSLNFFQTFRKALFVGWLCGPKKTKSGNSTLVWWTVFVMGFN